MTNQQEPPLLHVERENRRRLSEEQRNSFLRRSAGEEHERLGTSSSGLGGGPLSDASTAVAPLSGAYSDANVRLSPARIFYPISRCECRGALALCVNHALPPACHVTSRRPLGPAQRVPNPWPHEAPHARNPLPNRTDSTVILAPLQGAIGQHQASVTTEPCKAAGLASERQSRQ